VLNFWGTWCYPWRAEHPTLRQAQREARVQIIGVDWRDENADALEWLSRLGNPYTQVISDRSGDTAINLGIAKAPESFLVNPQGVIVYKEAGVITPEIWQRQFLSRLPPQSTVPVANAGGS
jgi:cytochrome c biogenesis protein CcmG/thiol:disulfide interchange protein DsbE